VRGDDDGPQLRQAQNRQERSTHRWPPPLQQTLGSVLALTCLAVAYPVLELLGRNAAFFVARGAVWVEPVGVAVALTTILPLMMVGGLAIWRVIHRPSAACAHLLLLGALAALLAIQVLDRVSWPHQ
jgi:uncharacterized membrane-anchored protein